MSSNPVFVAFDLETTGLVPGVDGIVELGAVAFAGGEVIDTFARLVDPGMPISPDARRVNGISDQMLRGAPAVAEALPDFLAVLARGTPVAHNAVFDVSFLSAALSSACLPPPRGPVLDTRRLALRAFPGRFSYGLAALVFDLRLPVEQAHRALADAHACRHLFQRCVCVLGKGRPMDLCALAEADGRPLDFAEHAPRHPRTAALIDGALRDGGTLEISYTSARGEHTSRTIRPLSFSRLGGRLAVDAYCLLRQANRTFLLDSISEARRGQ